MTKLETLTVPADLGEWLKGMILGESCRYFTMIDELFKYWNTVIDSPMGSFIAKNKKELIEVILGTREHEVEEVPLYHALIKGYELLNIDGIYWTYNKNNDGVFFSEPHSPDDNFPTALSKNVWGGLGINDSNADFVLVKQNN